MILADKLIKLRKMKGLSQEELAEKLGVTRQAVSRWEGAQTYPDLQKIVSISEFYNVSTDYLLKDGEEDIQKSFNESRFPEADSDLAKQNNNASENCNLRLVDQSEAEEYVNVKKHMAVRYSFACVLFILSVLPATIMALIKLAFKQFNSAIALSVGGIMFVAMIALGCFILVKSSKKHVEILSRFNAPFELDYQTERNVTIWKLTYFPHYRSLIVAATLLVLIMIIPVLYLSFRANWIAVASLSFITIACASAICVYVRTIYNSYVKILKKGVGSNKKSVWDVVAFLSAVYWLYVMSTYPLFVYLTDMVDKRWILFIIYAAIYIVAMVSLLVFLKVRKMKNRKAQQITD